MPGKSRPANGASVKPRRANATSRPAHRPLFEPTDEQRAYVRRQRLAGDTGSRLADAIGIHAQTLRKHFAHEIDHATRDLLGNIAAVVYQQALSGDMAAASLIMRTRAGWVERKELTGADGAPLAPSGPPVLLVQYVDSDDGAPAGGNG